MMRAGGAVLVLAAVGLLHGCPSAYQRTYDKETARLESEQRASDERAAAEHAAASRYAAVVYFEVGSAVVSEDGQRELRWFVEQMKPYPKVQILVQGFADSTGAEAKNRTLSEDRAHAVGGYLSGQGIASERIIAEGYGTDSPAASNVSAKGRRNNRRVEVTVR